jgi:superfamily II DNA or RNA helicase
LPAPPTSLTPGMSRAALEAWAREKQVSHWLRAPATTLVPLVSSRDAIWLWSLHGRKASLADLVVAASIHGRGSGTAKRAPRPLQNEAISLLVQRAEETAEGLAEEEARGQRPAPEEAPLRALQRRLQEARAALRAEGVLPRPRRAIGAQTLTLHQAPPSLRCEEAVVAWCSGKTNPAVTLDLEAIDATTGLSCACPGGEARCVVGLAAVEAALDLLERPPEDPTRAGLSALLGTPDWARALARLDRALGRVDAEQEDARELGWRVSAPGDGEISLTPVRCAPKKSRQGLRLLVVSPEAVCEGELPEASPLDRQVALLLQGRPAARGYSPEEGRLQDPVGRALALLVGHPRVFLGRTDEVPLAVTRGELSLRLAPDSDGGATVEAWLNGRPCEDAALAAFLSGRSPGGWVVDVDEARQECRVLQVNPAALDLLEALGPRPRFPKEALGPLMQRLDAIEAALPVALDPALAGEEIARDDWPVARLEALDGGALRFAVRVRPLPDSLLFVPGEGPEQIYGAGERGRVYTARDLAAERAQVDADVGELGRPEVPEDAPFTWTLEDPGQILGLLEALETHEDLFATEWVGPPIRFTRAAQVSDLTVTVGGQEDWFGLSGGLKIDGLAVPLLALLTAVRDDRPYIRVEGGAWVKLSESFRQQVAQAMAGVQQGRGGRLELSPLAAPAVARLGRRGATIDAPPRWTQLLERIREAGTLDPPPPAGLNADLRPYQREGWRWLARLSHWAPGGCLADDMGLGKTVQALALLLARADQGPALVVAPTSVGINWERETARFAPALKVRRYRGPERAEVLEDLGPGVLLITSYDLLARDREALDGVTFSTVVLDEAQAIKNPDTKRARSARSLEAGFRLALTGTPVENHTGELWSLFHFLTPGLLGSWKRFRRRFVLPIERGEDAGRRAALGEVIRPFLLRRTKGQVATDLPPREEIRVDVEPTDPEREIYEQARLAAVAQLINLGDTNESQRRFQVLAAITRLRQLACHPRLVDPTSTAPSAKLERLRELVEDLREEGHQALIFSQFTRHLALAREALEADGVSLRYLDGSTPPEKRQAEVDAFQRGEGEVFLISLKAGGTGLNLTAATYVIHLDPWWNPAVEDQATDRAHRIGQTQSVTVLRLVSQGTIEESILAMHDKKRALVEDLLAGTGAAASLTTDELLDLLRGGPMR